MRTPKHLPAREATDWLGRRTIPGATAMLTDRRVRGWTSGDNTQHRTKNGIYDPLTMLHIAIQLTNIDPNKPFRAKAMASEMNDLYPEIDWDPITIGRILHDFHETFTDYYGTETRFIPLRAWDSYDGGRYASTMSEPEAAKSMYDLIDDLTQLVAQQHEAEMRSEYPPRLGSPLSNCRSLTRRFEPAEVEI